ncbi:hypothetical protein ABH966_002453 [Lysinibacillus sp. RC46]|uniref:hypothetical protein n=1 Tax=Lysinibacillus sp. RC46 TaxID=3156295 RepID=UPI003513301D
MFFIAYLAIFLYLLLEFYRSSPVKEEKRNRGSSFFIGVVLALMVTIPEIIYFFTINKIAVFWCYCRANWCMDKILFDENLREILQ